jgi:hypothetical protein
MKVMEKRGKGRGWRAAVGRGPNLRKKKNKKNEKNKRRKKEKENGAPFYSSRANYAEILIFVGGSIRDCGRPVLARDFARDRLESSRTGRRSRQSASSRG